MYSKRRNRLIWVITLLAGAALVVSLILYALRQNINLFFTPSQIAQGIAPIGPRIRVGGIIQKESIQRGENLKIQFIISDFKETITVNYRGILPDLFREGQGVVAQGILQDGQFIADEILAKHDENYMPPEVTNTLKTPLNNNSQHTSQTPIQEPTLNIRRNP